MQPIQENDEQRLASAVAQQPAAELKVLTLSPCLAALARVPVLSSILFKPAT